jgi:hypothetical protein
MKAALRSFSVVLLAVGLLMCFVPNAFALFNNGGFETGNFGGWSTSQYLNPGLSLPQPFTGASIVKVPGGDDLTQIRGPYAEMSQTDANTGGALSYPLAGHYCAVVNYEGAFNNANSLTQTATAASGDVQADGKVHVQFGWAAVVQNPGHPANQQPYVYVAVNDVTKGTVLYQAFIFAGDPNSPIPWHTYGGAQYTDWQVLDIAPDSSALDVGDQVSIEVTAAGCSQGGHWGYVYVDHFGSFHPVTPHVTVADKAYDGSDSATISGMTLTGVQGSDDVSLSGGTATFDSARAGTGKTVTVTGLTLSGAAADDYMLTSFTATTTADITAIAPAVTTDAASAVTATGATSGGDVTSDGGVALTARGVCWSTRADPTIADAHTTNGTSAGTYTSSITGLTGNTTYHVRAYATNSVGTSYGADLSFATPCSVNFVTDGTAGATLTGDASQSVSPGDSATAMAANAPLGHHFVNWTVFHGSFSSTSNPLTLTNIENNITVTAHFAIDTFSLTYAAGAHGAISGTTPQTVDYGTDGAEVTAVPSTGYHFVRWSDGVLTASRTDTTVTGALNVTASFAIDTFVINASAGQHGDISPKGAVSVDYGSDKSFTITPDAHYRVADVLVDGVSVGRVASHTFSAVTGAHTIAASFVPSDPPITKVKGLPSGWAPRFVTLRFSASHTSLGAPVAYTEYRIGWAHWRRGTTATITREGVTRVKYRSVDTVGNVEKCRTLQVHIDVTAPKAAYSEVNVLQGRTAKFSYRLSDNLAKTLRCRLIISRHGKTLVVKALGQQPVGRRLVAKMHCTMPAHGSDAYSWRIEAVDAAGNVCVKTWRELEVWTVSQGAGPHE